MRFQAPSEGLDAATPVTTRTAAAPTVFTRQGKLMDTGAPANANYDMQFTLWDAASGGTQQPQAGLITQTVPNVTASNGIFTVQLDFTVNASPGRIVSWRSV